MSIETLTCSRLAALEYNRTVKALLHLVLITILAAAPAHARTRRATSLPQLQSEVDAAKPGDRIVLKNGAYSTSQPLRVRGRHGTAASAIVIEAQSIGGATIAGTAGFAFENTSFVTIRGFRFTHASTQRVAPDSDHIRFTRNVFELAPEALHWLLVEGDDAEIDHNVFQNKKTAGVYLAIAGGRGEPPAAMAQRTFIHHNGFYDHSFAGANGGEGIRIGLSGLSLLSAHAVVEHNLFERHNGDPEAVSVKSSDNTVRANTVRDSKGCLVLRHGNRTTVESNFVLNCRCGIRFYGNDHRILNNYIAGATSEAAQEPGWGAAITVGSGTVADHRPEDSPSSRRGRDASERVLVAFNTLVGNAESIVGEKREFPARDCVFANNVVMSAHGPLVKVMSLDPLLGFKWEGNVFWGAEDVGDVPASGYRRVDPKLSLHDGLYRPEATSPLIDAAVGTYEIAADMDGQERGAAKDVGADELSTAAGQNRPLTPADVGPEAP
jgi:poly(beta-D-mannuronate) lyase